MASPSALICKSHSMAELAAAAAAKAEGVFSITPAPASCRPRCATGRAISQSRPDTERCRSGHFEQAFDLDRRIEGQGGYSHGAAGMPALVAEHLDHQVGSPFHPLGAVHNGWIRIVKTAEPHLAPHLVQIADRGLDLGEQ